MPTYEYLCEQCGEFEAVFKIGKAPRSLECPTCGKQSKKLISSSSFHLKGEGWPGKTRSFDREMTERNRTAGERMRREHTAPKVVAYDYGDGDVREASHVQRQMKSKEKSKQ